MVESVEKQDYIYGRCSTVGSSLNVRGGDVGDSSKFLCLPELRKVEILKVMEM